MCGCERLERSRGKKVDSRISNSQFNRGPYRYQRGWKGIFHSQQWVMPLHWNFKCVTPYYNICKRFLKLRTIVHVNSCSISPLETSAHIPVPWSPDTQVSQFGLPLWFQLGLARVPVGRVATARQLPGGGPPLMIRCLFISPWPRRDFLPVAALPYQYSVQVRG